jgi:hypothetical protein
VPIESRWRSDEQLWVLTPGETFDLSEIIELLRDTDWLGARRYLWDMQSLVVGPDTTGDLRQMLVELERLAGIWSGSRVAIIVSSDLHFGVARMFTSFAVDLDVEYQIFRDAAEARGWLDA